MAIRYLKAISDVEASSAWALNGTVPAATHWQSQDGDSVTNPPTSDGDVDYSAISNALLAAPGDASPFRLRVRFANSANPPIKKGGHTFWFSWRRAGTGSFGGGDTWPSVEVWSNGARVIGPIAQVRPGTAYVDISVVLTAGQAGLIDWTAPLDVAWNSPTLGAAICGARITRAWWEIPEAWSLEASSSALSLGEAEWEFSNSSGQGEGTSEGQVAGLSQVVDLSGRGTSEGVVTGENSSGVLSGLGLTEGFAHGFPATSLEAVGEGLSEGVLVGSLLLPVAPAWAGAEARAVQTGVSA